MTLKRNYEALGRAVYESRKQGIDSTEEIDDIIILINEKYDELMRSMSNCPK